MPVLNGVRARLNSRGWDDRVISLGLFADMWPSQQVVDFFKSIAPETTWAMHCHPIATTNIYGAAVRHAATAIADAIDFLDATLQEAEARIYIEKVLSDDGLRGGLPSELVERSEKILDERLNAWLIGCMCWDWFIGSGWQERTRLLFDTAGEIGSALKAQRQESRPAG